MKNQIIRTYLADPERLELPPNLDYAEVFVHALLDRADLLWKNGEIHPNTVVPPQYQDQPMVGFPTPQLRKEGRPFHLVRVDRDDIVVDPPDEPALMAEINAWVDQETPPWFEGSLYRDFSLVMPGSLISKLPYTLNLEETFLYYALFRMLRIGGVGSGKIGYVDDAGYDNEMLETYLLYGLVQRIREEDANILYLGDIANAEMEEARRLVTVDGDGSTSLLEGLRKEFQKT